MFGKRSNQALAKWTVIGLFVLGLISCGSGRNTSPPPKTEFRGVWIATVANIDWPDSGKDSWEDQKKSYLEILDYYNQLNFNAVIVQIRTAGDALYPSELAPWSRYLTGEEGKAPETDEDPLVWLIDEAHKRGFEFHAWLNPYRATMSMNTDILSEDHDFYLHPEWMIPYGTRYYYNPGLPEVRQHLVALMDEVTENYKIDGLHFDDYFYPYTIKDEVFRDSSAYKSYAPEGQSLDQWRRSNIDSLIYDIHHNLKNKKPWVQFGISPFGVWKNKSQDDPEGSDTRAGQTTYYDLYADPIRWMKEGWIDYLVPQLYWSMDFEPASYRKLTSWWADRSDGVNLYIGNGVYKVENNKDEAWNSKQELPDQLRLARSEATVKGNVFFSANSLMKKHKKHNRYLKKKIFKYDALVPSSPAPRIALYQFPELADQFVTKDEISLNFIAQNPSLYKFAVVYATKGKKSVDTKNPSQIQSRIFLDNSLLIKLNRHQLNNYKRIAITFIDQFGLESQPIVIHLDQHD